MVYWPQESVVEASLAPDARTTSNVVPSTAQVFSVWMDAVYLLPSSASATAGQRPATKATEQRAPMIFFRALRKLFFRTDSSF